MRAGLKIGFLAVAALAGPILAPANAQVQEVQPPSEVAAKSINEARKKAGVPELKPSPALAEFAAELSAQIAAGGKREAVTGFKDDPRRTMAALKEKGFEVKAARTIVRAGTLNLALAAIVQGFPRTDDTAAPKAPAWTYVGAARGPNLGGQEFYVLILATSAGEAAAGMAKGAAASTETPEDAVRALFYAMAIGDSAAIQAVAQDDPDLDILGRGQKAPPEAVAGMLQMPAKLLKPGDTVVLPGGRSIKVQPAEVGPNDAVVQPEGAPTPFRVKKIAGKWKVDASPLIAARKAADAARKKGSAKKKM